MTSDLASDAPSRQRVLVLGATGTIGQAAVKSLLRDGHEVVCFIRANGQSYRILVTCQVALGWEKYFLLPRLST